MPRNNKRTIFDNSSAYYAPLRRSRDLRSVTQYATPMLRNPTTRERASVAVNKHIWKYGDRLYNLAHKYYGDSTFWWTIAWWNGYGIEGDIKTGAIIYIPLDITAVIKILGV